MIRYWKRFWLHKLEITQANQIIEFSFKLPNHYGRLNSISMSPSFENVVNKDIEQVGELSIQLNNRSSSAIHLMCEYINRPKGENDQSYQLNEELKSNQLISGYFRDKTYQTASNKTREFIPYTLKIYLHCSINKING